MCTRLSPLRRGFSRAADASSGDVYGAAGRGAATGTLRETIHEDDASPTGQQVVWAYASRMSATYDELLAELLDIDRRLRGLAEDDFAERFPLKARRADLKNEIAAMAGSEDDRKSVQELQGELDRARAALSKAVQGHLRNNAAGSGTASLGAAMGGWSEGGVNERIDQAADRNTLEARVAKLERLINARPE